MARRVNRGISCVQPKPLPVNFERLFSLLASIHPLSDDFKASIEREIRLLSLPGNYFLLEAPDVCRHAWFLDSGFAMAYTYTEGRMRVENFWKPGQIILSLNSFFKQTPSCEFIELMVPGRVISIGYDGVQRLFQNYPEAHYIYESVVNQYYERSRERADDLRHLQAEDRYRKLISTFPQIEQCIRQDHIASYIGIAPQSLSRLRRMMRKL